MVIRQWRGRAAKSNEDAYPLHFRTNVLPELRRMAGFVGAYLCQRNLDERIEFIVLTKWQSMDAVHAFAGEDAGKAVVEPGAVAALVDYDTRVEHYEIIESV